MSKRGSSVAELIQNLKSFFTKLVQQTHRKYFYSKLQKFLLVQYSGRNYFKKRTIYKIFNQAVIIFIMG